MYPMQTIFCAGKNLFHCILDCYHVPSKDKYKSLCSPRALVGSKKIKFGNMPEQWLLNLIRETRHWSCLNLVWSFSWRAAIEKIRQNILKEIDVCITYVEQKLAVFINYSWSKTCTRLIHAKSILRTFSYSIWKLPKGWTEKSWYKTKLQYTFLYARYTGEKFMWLILNNYFSTWYHQFKPNPKPLLLPKYRKLDFDKGYSELWAVSVLWLSIHLADWRIWNRFRSYGNFNVSIKKFGVIWNENKYFIWYLKQYQNHLGV